VAAPNFAIFFEDDQASYHLVFHHHIPSKISQNIQIHVILHAVAPYHIVKYLK
jgi:hypothetical protein